MRRHALSRIAAALCMTTCALTHFTQSHVQDKSMATSCMSAEQGTIPATAGAVGCKTQRVEVLEVGVVLCQYLVFAIMCSGCLMLF